MPKDKKWFQQHAAALQPHTLPGWIVRLLLTLTATLTVSGLKFFSRPAKTVCPDSSVQGPLQ